ncbi:TrbC/VirB2 family protein [Qipengyuania citrea]|jgi:type IV secretory pathway VirB2 component (pilin)|uniref:TrbC/VirB2 family protein n=1 Tax=Qipengyuania citrea TaxID=225971 RepID=A0ABY4U6I0_9SPHN|nr:TrbC/VirB2 family protein [Qipengyuania citrea]USA61366.1 TrbC/VirB2 family protein [Qipengyuania citrea]
MSIPLTPVGSESALAASIAWINGLLLGSLATGLCVLGVSLVGFLMLMGQIPIRHGMRVILGCFVLLGAPVIAAGLAGAWQSASPPAPDPEVYVPTEVREPLPPADYDPYAGASLRRE